MKKAYDVKELGEMVIAEAKKEGLTLAEDAVETLAKAAYLGLKQWFNESAVLSPNPVDNFIAPALGYLDGFILPEIEKIDLDKDGK